MRPCNYCATATNSDTCAGCRWTEDVMRFQGDN